MAKPFRAFIRGAGRDGASQIRTDPFELVVTICFPSGLKAANSFRGASPETGWPIFTSQIRTGPSKLVVTICLPSGLKVAWNTDEERLPWGARASKPL